MSDTDIYHFGVKGMKWGVIRKKATKGRVIGGVAGYAAGTAANNLAFGAARALIKNSGGNTAGLVAASGFVGIGVKFAGAYMGVKIADRHGGRPKND